MKLFKKTSKKLKLKKPFNSYLLTAFATVFIVIGLVSLLNVFAAPAPNGKSSEAETSTVTQNTTTVADTTASGGNYLELKQATTTPPPTGTCPNPKHTPGGDDGMGGCWPYEGNTGVPAGTVLTNYTGPCTITSENTIIDKKSVDCNLDIRAPNVVITNSKINGAIIVDSADCGKSYSYNISNSTIFTPDINLRGLLYCNYNATKVDVSGGQSMAWCDTCTIQDSYLHGPLEDPAGAAANRAAHNSTVRMSKNALIKHNTLWCAVKEYSQPNGQDTSGCSANQTGYSHDGAPPYNSRIEANLYMPTTGGFCAYGGSTTGALSTVRDIVFINNIFKRGTNPSDKGQYVCGYYGTITSFDSSRPENQWINNRYDDGTTVNP